MSLSEADPVMEKAYQLVREEFIRAYQRHGDFNSLHEGYAVLLEESDELWDIIKHKRPDLDEVINEATQVAAMGIKMLVFTLRNKAKKS